MFFEELLISMLEMSLLFFKILNCQSHYFDFLHLCVGTGAMSYLTKISKRLFETLDLLLKSLNLNLDALFSLHL